MIWRNWFIENTDRMVLLQTLVLKNLEKIERQFRKLFLMYIANIGLVFIILKNENKGERGVKGRKERKREKGRIRTCKFNKKIQELWNSIFKIKSILRPWLPMITPNMTWHL